MNLAERFFSKICPGPWRADVIYLSDLIRWGQRCASLPNVLIRIMGVEHVSIFVNAYFIWCMQPLGYGAAKYKIQGTGLAVSLLSLLFPTSLLRGYADV